MNEWLNEPCGRMRLHAVPKGKDTGVTAVSKKPKAKSSGKPFKKSEKSKAKSLKKTICFPVVFVKM